MGNCMCLSCARAILQHLHHILVHLRALKFTRIKLHKQYFLNTINIQHWLERKISNLPYIWQLKKNPNREAVQMFG